jgi:hypothetical protein
MRRRMVALAMLALGLALAPASAQPPGSDAQLSSGFIDAAKVYYRHIRTLEASKAPEMTRDESRAYDQAREGTVVAQATFADRTVMSLLRQYSVLVSQFRAGVVQAGRSDFRLPPERAQVHARCRTEIERSLETATPFQNAKCSAAMPAR